MTLNAKLKRTPFQEEEYFRLRPMVQQGFGEDSADRIERDFIGVCERQDASEYDLYNLVIEEFKRKLNAPILDDVEYHEIMRAQEIMEGT